MGLIPIVVNHPIERQVSMLIRSLIKTLALPPAINILVILFALVFLASKPRLRNSLIFLAIASLTLLAMPVSTDYLAQGLETFPALDVDRINGKDYQAIVILGAGRHRNAIEYGSDVPKAMGLERLRYGALLQRKTGLPILVTGGMWDKDRVPESEFMESIIEHEFMGSVLWQEDQSRTTWENAKYSKRIATENQIQKVLLVTHAWHMPRAAYSFEKANLSFTAAPTGFRSGDKELPDVLNYIPQASALHTSVLMLHEMLGLLWYRFVYE